MTPEGMQQMMQLYQDTPVNRKDVRRPLEEAIRAGLRYFFEDTNPPELTAEEHAMAQRNEKIPAIRVIRARTGLGLKEAKDLYEKSYPQTPR
jgi:hypothetical protein